MHSHLLLLSLAALALGHAYDDDKCTRSTVTETVTAAYPPTCSNCYYAMDACGQNYGGCWNACETPDVPSFSQPDCTPATTTTWTSSSSSYNPCTLTVCVDKINECGKAYGGCYNLCSTPTFTKPTCPPTHTSTYGPEESCTATICADYINDCGIGYGGCYNECETPTFTPPPCPSTTSSTCDSSSDTSTACPSICVDYVNDCGQWYGGCYNSCETPTFVEPPCSITSTKTGMPTNSYYEAPRQ